MATQLLIRFLLGGTLVCAFALIGDVLRPKSFAGIFGAAPSVALATLVLTVHDQGAPYAATEARSMIVGAVALLIYAAVCAHVMWKARASVATITIVALPFWLICALIGAGLLLLRSAP